MDLSKNIILYGSPGIGKTCNTVTYAVAIIENRNYEEVCNEDYEDVLTHYK